MLRRFRVTLGKYLFRILVDVYRKDPTLRTSRSPLRTVAVDKSQVLFIIHYFTGLTTKNKT